MGFELVRIAVLGRERPTVQIMADRADGPQIAVEDCQLISHDVSAAMDVDDPIPVPGRWRSVRPASPAIDPSKGLDPIRRPPGPRRDFLSQNGRKRFAGVVLGADDDVAGIRLEDGSEVGIRDPDIRRAKLVLTDALIEAIAAKKLAN